MPFASIDTLASHVRCAASSGGENRARRNAAPAESRALVASSHFIHIWVSTSSAVPASVVARPESLRMMAAADWASVWVPDHWLAWNVAHAVAKAAIPRRIAVHESGIRCRRSQGS